MKQLLLLLVAMFLCSPLYAAMSFTTSGGATGNGGDVETITSAPTFALTNFSTCTWAKFQAAPNGTANFKTLWSRINGAGSVSELWWYLDTTGKVDVWINNAHTIGLQNTAITNTNWHHFCLTKSGTTWTSFIDGAQDKQVVDATAQNNMNGTAGIIFGQNNPLNHHCRCTLAEVAGWNVTLTAAEITRLNKGVVPGYVHRGALLLWIPMYGRSGTGGLTGVRTQDLSSSANLNQPQMNTRAGNVLTDNHCPGCSMPPGTN